MPAMKRLILVLLMAFWGATGALAEEPVQREVAGRIQIFHRAVCSRVVGVGHARCFAHVRTDSMGNPMEAKRSASGTYVPSGYAPADLRAAYNITATGSSSTIVAVVDAYGYANAEADLAVYRAKYGLPACTRSNGCFIKLSQGGSTSFFPRYDAGWAQEQALDLDVVSAMCPRCKIMLVQANNDNTSSLAASVNTAISRGATVVSNSYGGGEQGTATLASYYNHTGIAITASAGDNGYGTSFPASAPGVIAVGGTTLNPDSSPRGWSETVWNGTGSGCSTVFAKPSWQTDTLCTRRMMADIAAVADPATGVAVYGPVGRGTTSGWMVFGGTSVSAPLIAGIYGATGARPTAAQKIWQSVSGLNDVTSGSNGSCGGTYFCTAGPGYDGPTGKGTPWGTAAF